LLITLINTKNNRMLVINNNNNKRVVVKTETDGPDSVQANK